MPGDHEARTRRTRESPSGTAPAWRAIAVATILALTLARYLSICLALPYDYNWDMDLMASLDTLAVNGGQLPVHIAHPGFGLSFVHAATERVAHAIGSVSILRLEDLARTLNPLAAMAEYTELVRLHSPFVAWATVVALWLGLRRLLSPRPLADVGLLALLASQDGLLYQAGLVRSELYGVFFWSVALVLLARTVDTRTRARRVRMLVATGVLLGLSYLTKLQGAFLLTSIPLLLVHATSETGGIAALLETRTREEARTAAAAALLALALFAALLLGAAATADPPRDAYLMFTASWPLRLTATGAGALLAYAAVAGLLVWLARRGRWDTGPFAFLHASALLLLGFVLSFALHLVPFGPSSTGLRYLLYDTKMLFFRSSLTVVYVAGGPLEQLWRQIEWDPALFALAGLVGSTAALRAWRARWKSPAGVDALSMLGLALLVFANATIAVRFNFRDLVWAQVLGLVVAVVAAPPLFHGKPTRIPTAVLLALVLVGQLLHGRDMVARLEANFNVTGFDDERWFSGLRPLVTAGAYERYAAIMQQHYGDPGSPLRAAARRSARRHGDDRRIAGYVLHEPGIDLRRIGVLAEGFPLWVGAPDARVEQLPEALREAMVIDPGGVSGGGVRFVPEEVREHSGLREKIGGRGEPGSLALLPRPDLRVFLFHPETSDRGHLPPCADRAAAPPPPGRLVAAGATLVGREITTYCIIPAADLPPSSIVVVLRDDGRVSGRPGRAAADRSGAAAAPDPSP